MDKTVPQRVTLCQLCGVPGDGRTRLYRGRCLLCHRFCQELDTAREREMVGRAVREVWKSRGVDVDATVAVVDRGEEELDDPWEGLLVAWISTERPQKVFLLDALRAVGVDPKRARRKDRRRVKRLLEELGRPVLRRRFAVLPQGLGLVKIALAKREDASTVRMADLEGAIPEETGRRAEILIGHCLVYLGYQRHRYRGDDGRRQTRYVKA